MMLLIALLVTLNVKSIQAQATPTPTPTPSTAESNNLIQTSIHSTIMAEDRRVIIHLPRNYSKDTAKKYPVMSLPRIWLKRRESRVPFCKLSAREAIKAELTR
jgi:hypothetical protein